MSNFGDERYDVYARGMADALAQTADYLARYGPADLPEWLQRREAAFRDLITTQPHGTDRAPDTERSES